jgi:glutamine amidotransferase
MTKITIVDYGAGNLRSVARAVAHVGYQARVDSSPESLRTADAVILPGVGAAADTMRNLNDRGLVGPVREYIESGRPFLGICMGLQALFDVSEEGGEHECLGVLPGRVKRLPPGLKIPHMGWNEVYVRQNGTIFDGIPSGQYFYFVHSYYVEPEDRSIIAGETDYGITFPAAVVSKNVVATQFHPEKSGECGLRIYKNFLRAAVGVPPLVHTSPF